MSNKYLTPNVSDLTEAPRDRDVLFSYATISQMNALIDFKAQHGQIDQVTALTLFNVARLTAAERVTNN